MLPLVYSRRRPALSHGEREERAMMALESVGLADRADHEPNELSGGQRQRVEMASELVNDPVVIMVDEPTGNLDTRTGNEIMELMHDLHRHGSTIILVTHEHDIAVQTERTITLVDGKIATDGATSGGIR
jgi:putative ABC transport system ATP-binding protein